MWIVAKVGVVLPARLTHTSKKFGLLTRFFCGHSLRKTTLVPHNNTYTMVTFTFFRVDRHFAHLTPKIKIG